MGMSRSDNMRRILSKNTSPEISVRLLLRKLGFTGYRLHKKELPGKPDIVFIGLKKAIFVHGCFWHGHQCKEGIRKPKSNLEYWGPKISHNRNRDTVNMHSLQAMGWAVLTIWECEINDISKLTNELIGFLKSSPTP